MIVWAIVLLANSVAIQNLLLNFNEIVLKRVPSFF